MTFEEHIADAKKRMDLGRWPAPALICALEALAAERAAEREDAHDIGERIYRETGGPTPALRAAFASYRAATASTPYTRAMTSPRMGGQHPHDGRHIMSIGSWGMH